MSTCTPFKINISASLILSFMAVETVSTDEALQIWSLRKRNPPAALQMRWGWGGQQRRLWGTQWDSPLTELPSPRGEEERESPRSVFSEPEPFWLWWSAVEAELEDVAEVDGGLAFSLKSVMMTVRSPTVTSRCWALLRSMFFNLGLTTGQKINRMLLFF